MSPSTKCVGFLNVPKYVGVFATAAVVVSGGGAAVVVVTSTSYSFDRELKVFKSNKQVKVLNEINKGLV